ncbi:hypothetical protein AB0A76_00810 [Streptomyces exfoliatus]|uniref:Uncharacterized protein n=1 Tax=Streptomyces exfoliatus TaxID=1905 RepID=A0ABV3CNG6_STREX
MTEWGMRVERSGCWLSWKNLEDLVAVFEDVLPDGELVIRRTTESSKSQDNLTFRTTQTREWNDLGSFRNSLTDEQTVTDIRIERIATSDQRRVSFAIGSRRIEQLLHLHHFTCIAAEGGTNAWEEGVTVRAGVVLNQARFLGSRPAKWLTRLKWTFGLISGFGLVVDGQGAAALVGLGALWMTAALSRIHYWLTQSMLVHEPRRIRKFLVQRSANHPGTGSPGQTAVVLGALAAIAGIVSGIVAVLDYLHG